MNDLPVTHFSISFDEVENRIVMYAYRETRVYQRKGEKKRVKKKEEEKKRQKRKEQRTSGNHDGSGGTMV